MKEKKRILVVEDEPAVARGLKTLLEGENYAVKVVSNGADAVTSTSSFSPDLMLLDVNLPQMNGAEACRQVRARGYANAIIMLTAQREQVDKIVGFDAGADDYVTKPFDARELLARIRAHLRKDERLAERTSALHPTAGNRRLLSLMFTDIKDFSKNMNRSEEHALRMLETHNTTVQKAVDRFDGRVIEVIGDAFLVAFESALKAVECGLAILRAFARHNQKKGVTDHIHLRIGIHVGDVLEVQGKLRGDAVNIAARLQQSATPDHILISESVFDAIRRSATSLHITKLGNKELKNIRQPVTVYRVTP